jgi:hypothetical protein
VGGGGVNKPVQSVQEAENPTESDDGEEGNGKLRTDANKTGAEWLDSNRTVLWRGEERRRGKRWRGVETKRESGEEWVVGRE